MLRKQTREILLGILIIPLSLAPYLQTSKMGLILLDDYAYVAAQTPISAGLTVNTIRWALKTREEGLWMPVTRLSYALDATLAGESSGFMHLHNTWLHALNAVLVYLLLLRCFSSPVAAAIGAAMWSLHPLRVEPVVWIASRKDLLSFFWGLCGLLLWMHRREEGADATDRQEDRRLVGLRVAGFGCFILSYASKPIAVVLPLLAGLLELLRTGRLRWKLLLPLVSAALVGAWFASVNQALAGAGESLAKVPLLARLANAVAALGIYVWQTIWPAKLAVQCFHRWPDPPAFLWGGLLICLVMAVALVAAACRLVMKRTANHAVEAKGAGLANNVMRDRVLFVSFAWFVVAAAPTLGIIAFGYHAHADRFTYLPAVGFSLLAAAGCRSLISSGTASRGVLRLAGGLVIGVLALLGGLAYRQTGFWESNLKLFSRTLAVEGGVNLHARAALGLYFYEEDHQPAKVVDYMLPVFEIEMSRKELGDTTVSLVLSLCELGRLDEARDVTQRFAELAYAKAFEKARAERSRPAAKNINTYLCYAAIAVEEGDSELAERHLQTIPHGASDMIADYIRGRAALRKGDRASAIEHWRASMSRSRSYVRHRFLGAEIDRLEKILADSKRNMIELSP